METELDLDALPALASLARRWKRAHDEGLAHVEAIPDLFAAAAAAASEEGRGFESSPSPSPSAAAPEPSRAGEVVRRAALEFEDGILRQEDRMVFQDGEQVELERGVGLFQTDQLAATASILDGASPYASMDQVLAALGLADSIVGQA